MNYKQCMEFVEETKRYGVVPGLDSIRNLMSELGNVQERLAVVHIAGTNGKGSVGAFLSSVLCQAGYHTGWFSSPEVFSYEEMFRYDGEPADREEIAEAFTQVKEACGRLVRRGLPHPTRFEAETAAAFVLFAKKNCDLVLMEAGMGGAQDATNVTEKPALSVLTSISMDHMRYLGGTPAQIAENKAGIIKAGCPVVAVKGNEEADRVIHRRCGQTKSALVWADANKAADIKRTGEYLWFCYGGETDRQNEPGEAYQLAMTGICQVENAVCAIEAARVLRHTRCPTITEKAIRAGLKSTALRGRFSKLASNPEIYLDGAHNADGAKKLRETLEFLFGDETLICIMGVFSDKETDRILDEMLPKAERVITVTPDNPRALDGGELAELIRKRGATVECAPTVKDALWRGIDEAVRENRRLLAFGSFSYLGELEREYQNRQTDYINRILRHPLFLDTLRRIEALERDRVYCCHRLEHLLDVARMAWIMYLEDKSVQKEAEEIQKTDVYVCALLHDLGRADQYEHGKSHVEEGIRIARRILFDMDYPQSRREEILRAIGMHCQKEELLNSGERNLAFYIARADHMSRNCFMCKAAETCKWKTEIRNQFIEI